MPTPYFNLPLYTVSDTAALDTLLNGQSSAIDNALLAGIWKFSGTTANMSSIVAPKLRAGIEYLATDTGIALANMTLAAWDKGVGSCIMGAINKPALTELLGIEEPQKLAFMVAFGYPTHKAHIVPLTAETGVKYYLDENRDYCVPKRSKEEIAKYL